MSSVDPKLLRLVSKAKASIPKDWLSLPNTDYKKLVENRDHKQIKALETISFLHVCEAFLGRSAGTPLVRVKDTLGKEIEREEGLASGERVSRYRNSDYLSSGGWVSDIFPSPHDQATEILQGPNALPMWRDCADRVKIHMMIRALGALGGGLTFNVNIDHATAEKGKRHMNGLVRFMQHRVYDAFKGTRFAGRPMLFVLELTGRYGVSKPHLHGAIQASDTEKDLLKVRLSKTVDTDETPSGPVRQIVPIRNEGWAHYISKQLGRVRAASDRQPYHANRPIISLGEPIYQEAKVLVRDAREAARELLGK